MCFSWDHIYSPLIRSRAQILPWLSWLRPSSWHFVAPPGGGVRNRSPLTCVRVSLLFPGNIFQKSKCLISGELLHRVLSWSDKSSETHFKVFSTSWRRVWKRAEIEASGYLDLRELGRVVLHGAHYLVTDFLFIVIPQQIFTLKHRTKQDILLPGYWDVWRGGDGRETTRDFLQQAFKKKKKKASFICNL